MRRFAFLLLFDRLPCAVPLVRPVSAQALLFCIHIRDCPLLPQSDQTSCIFYGRDDPEHQTCEGSTVADAAARAAVPDGAVRGIVSIDMHCTKPLVVCADEVRRRLALHGPLSVWAAPAKPLPAQCPPVGRQCTQAANTGLYVSYVCVCCNVLARVHLP